MRFLNYLIERRCYTGVPLEKGGTSIQGGVAPGVKFLFDKGLVKPGMKVLDYGAGKYARNADFLRGNGVRCYAYDPFNSNGSEGWELGSVSGALPRDKDFDAGFSCFVLNVVPCHVEDSIVKDLRSRCRVSFHVTRNTDVFDMVKKALAKGDRTVCSFYYKEFLGQPVPAELRVDVDDETVMELCKFGVQTSRGFQRIPDLEDRGAKLLRKTTGFKIYQV
jgi:hypothetical protein